MDKLFDKLENIGAEIDDTLERFMDDEELYYKYVVSFPDEPTMTTLVKAVDEKDYEQAEKSVHALKGIANNLGFIPLADATVDMLAELRDDNIPAALDAYKDVESEYRKFCDVIKSR